MKVIMISGKSQSGKDTIARMMYKILQDHGAKTLIISFADPVKWIAERYYNWNGDKTKPEGRALLQKIGTTIMRTHYPTYWAEIIGKFISAANEWDCVIIPDLRFQNEFETISEHNINCETIRIERYNQDGSSYVNPNMTKEQLNHISECELDNFPFEWVIENRGSLEELEESAKELLNIWHL